MTTRVFTGLKPTGRLQVGNYLGAIRPMVDFAADPENDLLVFVADLHALTIDHDPAQLRARTLEAAATLLACGLESRAKLFVQSSVPAPSELSYLLESTATHGETGSTPREALSGLHGAAALKQAVTEALIETLIPIQNRYAELTGDPAELQRLLRAGRDAVTPDAQRTVAAARAAMGLLAVS